ncbi:crosslink repair DNA glycosylase YcaQ family protein [Sphaerisporangium sp. TRM90804]|uniref:winged helix-turn-helix domain-containing protein n=1 Tax=Sphaerisporangium sp. TRM90804 TaxID=3031113 RepID=UPI002446ACCB|nr:crosslink repair DNA glycosylase YcaQ family protein [Sphaerisporangium sp. TRM90804]MDH2427861.1 crosslink repair DNA glycosylase YcaQ family protein [Sphaerisporangium sp. TRM90804]
MPTGLPTPAIELSAGEARGLILRAQGLLGAGSRKGGPEAVLRRLGAVQLDTISVLARSHELVAYARAGAVGRAAVENAYWREPAAAFEYWCHAACVLPIDHWPLYAFRRRAYRERGIRWHEVPATIDKVLEQVRNEGPLTTTELGGAKNGGPWWDWSDVKISVEFLLDIGEVVCTRRVGWRRVYDVAERVVPSPLLAQEPTDAECVARLARVAGAAMGVATRADLVDFLRLRGAHAALLDQALLDGSTGLVPVRVAGWAEGRGSARTAWADAPALESAPRGRHRTTPLSPFDSLVWDRARTERVFGFTHRLEAYVPRPKRVHGYFSMPVLAGGRLIGRFDPAREGATLVARQVGFEPGPRGAVRGEAVEAMGQALREAAAWVGCDDVRVERLSHPEVAAALDAALRAPAA